MAESKAKELGKTFQNLALYARSVSNTFNVIQGKLKKASEYLSKASDDDPEAAKVASQAVNGVDAEVRQQCVSLIVSTRTWRVNDPTSKRPQRRRRGSRRPLDGR